MAKGQAGVQVTGIGGVELILHAIFPVKPDVDREAEATREGDDRRGVSFGEIEK